MDPHETVSTGVLPSVPQGPTLGAFIDAYLQDYQVHQFRSLGTARGRVAHLAAYFGRDVRAVALTTPRPGDCC